MRTRRIFSLDKIFQDKKKFIATAVPIFYKRDRSIVDEGRGINIIENRLNGGSLFNLRYIPTQNSWLDITTGLEGERVRSKGTAMFRASRVGFDDIVLSGGKGFFPTKNLQCVIYGIAGFPTRLKVEPFEVQDSLVGTRFFSLGAGSELSYTFFSSMKKTCFILFQNRFLHFFKRSWPFTPAGGKIVPGNVTDLLFGAHYRSKRNIFEAGYNPTLFTNQAIELPYETIKSDLFVRHSVYATYTCLYRELPLLKIPAALGAGISIGRSKKFDTKIITGWLSATTVF